MGDTYYSIDFMEMSDLHEYCSQALNEKKQLQKIFNRINSELLNKKKTLADSRKEYLLNQNLIKQVKKNTFYLESKFLALDDNRDSLTEEFRQGKETLKAVNEKIPEIEEEIEQVRNSIKNFSKESEFQKQEHAKLKKTLDELDLEKQNLSDNISHSLDKTEHDREEMEEQLTEINVTLIDSIVKRKDAKEKYNDLNDAISKTSEKIESFQKESDFLDGIKTKIDKKSETEVSLKNLQAELEETLLNQEKLKKQKSKDNKTLSDKISDTENLKKKITDRNLEVKDYKNALETREHVQSELKTSLELTEKEYQELKQALLNKISLEKRLLSLDELIDNLVDNLNDKSVDN